MGLGLSVAHSFTTTMGGALTAEDTPGGGLTVVISLPARSARQCSNQPGTGATAPPRPGRLGKDRVRLPAMRLAQPLLEQPREVVPCPLLRCRTPDQPAPRIALPLRQADHLVAQRGRGKPDAGVLG